MFGCTSEKAEAFKREKKKKPNAFAKLGYAKYRAKIMSDGDIPKPFQEWWKAREGLGKK